MPSAYANHALARGAAGPQGRQCGVRLPYGDGAGSLRRLAPAAHYLSLVLLSAVSIVAPLARQASAQTSVPGGSNLAAFSADFAPGNTLNLQGNATLFGFPTPFTQLLPSSLTINGVTDGSVITLNDSASPAPTQFGYFVGPNSSTTLTLSNVTIAGANNVGGPER